MNESTRSIESFLPSIPRFEVRCWGEFRLSDRLSSRDVSPRGRKARAVIAYLAAQVTAVSRERLAGLLWSERGDEQARASLRQTLSELRPHENLLIIDRDQVRLNVLVAASDIAALEILARGDDLDALSEALAEKGERLYEGLDGLDPAFDEWLVLERRTQHDRLLSHGLSAAVRGLNSGAFGEVARLATQLQALDPVHEMVTQIGMSADHARGDLSALRRRYQRLREALAQDLGVTPSPETKALFADLAEGKRLPPAAKTPTPLVICRQNSGRTPPIIAVLPFTNSSEHPEDSVFARGLVDDLSGALSLSPWMRVVAASTAAIDRDGVRDLRQIGRDLSTPYLLEGSVKRMSENLRVATRLVETKTGAILWSQKFDRPLLELSACQEALVQELVGHLAGQVQRAETELAFTKPSDASAWDAFLRAMSPTLYQYPTLASYEDAVIAARQAITINPNDGAAYGTLAALQGQLLHHRGGSDPQLAQEIAENIRKARALNLNSAVVLAEVAGGLVGLRKLREALPLAERAVAMSPYDDNARHMLGAILARLGRSDEAIVHLDVADRLTPSGTWAYLSSLNRSIAHLLAGRPHQALSSTDEVAHILPGPELLIQRILCLATLDHWDRAGDTLWELRDPHPEVSRALTENLVRGLYCGSNAVETYVAMAGKVWDGIPQDA